MVVVVVCLGEIGWSVGRPGGPGRVVFGMCIHALFVCLFTYIHLHTCAGRAGTKALAEPRTAPTARSEARVRMLG